MRPRLGHERGGVVAEHNNPTIEERVVSEISDGWVIFTDPAHPDDRTRAVRRTVETCVLMSGRRPAVGDRQRFRVQIDLEGRRSHVEVRE
jgi:hypothetical protein